MRRTTVFLDDLLLRRAKQAARAEGRSLAALVREAIWTYVSAGPPARSRLPSVAGSFESGRSDTSERVGEWLRPDPHV
ncbi:MAG: hypothetical protein HY705_08465 [Gemmatimonadetes bacterium]|nr:hypothetical protein [Gemmatimonadota bacterium]